MLMRELVKKIEAVQDVPVFFEDRFDFAVTTYLTSNSTKKRGLYLPDCDTVEAINACKDITPYGYERIQRTVEEVVEFNDITFSLFSILHELGHWVQYTDYIKQGHDDKEFTLTHEYDRAILSAKRKFEYQECKSKESFPLLDRRFDKLYAELFTEKFANQYAKQLLPSVYYSINNAQ